jgi:hypothetical protein
MGSLPSTTSVGRVIAGVAILIALAAPAASTAEVRQIAYSEDGGRFPDAFASPSTGRPSALSYELQANPPAPVKLRWRVTCRVHSRSVGTEQSLNPVSPPFTGAVPLTVEEPDYCSWSVDAEYADFEQTGTLMLTLFAEIRPEWTRCSSPSWSRGGSLKARDIACGQATRIVRQAIQKRPEDGNFVRVGPFYCSRARLFSNAGARVNCHNDLERVKFQGRVKLRSVWLTGSRR